LVIMQEVLVFSPKKKFDRWLVLGRSNYC
jgi:hypothetical protein